MSDYEDSTITYTVASSPFGGLSDIGSPGVSGPLVMPEDPYAYVVAAFQAPPSPNYVSGPEYSPSPEFVPKPREKPGLLVRLRHSRWMPAMLPQISDYSRDTSRGDQEVTGSIPQATYTVYTGTDCTEVMSDLANCSSRMHSDLRGHQSPSTARGRTEREEIPEVNLSLQKRLCTAHTGTYELGKSSAAAAARLRELVRYDLYRFIDIVERGEGFTLVVIEISYSITDTWDDLVGATQETALTTVEGVNQRVTELSTTFDRETSMIYAMIQEKHDDQALQRCRVNIDAVRSRVIALRTQVSAQRIEITDLWAANHRFQTTVGTQQEEIRKLRAAYRKLHAQFIRDTRVPAQPEVPEEAGSNN
nr:hypothetical protein [Tanacetum cinerariifolium]